MEVCLQLSLHARNEAPLLLCWSRMLLDCAMLSSGALHPITAFTRLTVVAVTDTGVQSVVVQAVSILYRTLASQTPEILSTGTSGPSWLQE
jgi:hypothetical protein